MLASDEKNAQRYVSAAITIREPNPAQACTGVLL
jgi:hypothetical protein